MDIDKIWPYAAGILASVSAWWIGRRKVKAEAKTSELDTVEKAITIWRQLAEEMRTQVGKLQMQVEKLTQENVTLKSEIGELKAIVKERSRTGL